MNKLQPYIDRFNRLDLKARYAVFAGALLLVVLADYFLIMGPQLYGLDKLSEGIKNTSAETKRIKSQMLRIGDIKKGVEQTRLQTQALESKVRLVSEVPSVLDGMAAIANDSGVVIDQIVPSKLGPQAKAGGTGRKYYTLPIVVRGHSGYHMFGRFINKLESDRFLFSLKELRLEQNGASGLDIQATLEIVLADK